MKQIQVGAESTQDGFTVEFPQDLLAFWTRLRASYPTWSEGTLHVPLEPTLTGIVAAYLWLRPQNVRHTIVSSMVWAAYSYDEMTFDGLFGHDPEIVELLLWGARVAKGKTREEAGRNLNAVLEAFDGFVVDGSLPFPWPGMPKVLNETVLPNTDLQVILASTSHNCWQALPTIIGYRPKAVLIGIVQNRVEACSCVVWRAQGFPFDMERLHAKLIGTGMFEGPLAGNKLSLNGQLEMAPSRLWELLGSV